ncbi:hypothetical protein PGT21_037051 [Puccinia graminis f. sp. tritici]|uniref:Uncharacterized protein n=1 Tax=Puccinia graminis f. sp. tritici TaxID=56615 RepID=A0A5B0QE13_PUCGR|nr:hypothetical protein PGT21_037051 [Puccinia graminis f. sp. tritici]
MISLTSATTQKLKPPTFSFSYHNSSNPTHHLPYSSVSLSHLNLLKISAKRTLLTAVTQQPPHLSSPIPTPTYPPSTDPESKPNPPLTCYPAVALYKPQPTKALASPSTHNRLSVLQLLLDSSFYPRLIKHPATHTSSVNHHCSTAAPPNQPQPIQVPFLWLRTRRRATTASALPLIHSSLYPRLIKHTATHTSSVNHHCSTAAPPNQPQPIQVPFLWLRTRCRATTASALPLIQLIQYSKSQLPRPPILDRTSRPPPLDENTPSPDDRLSSPASLPPPPTPNRSRENSLPFAANTSSRIYRSKVFLLASAPYSQPIQQSQSRLVDAQ